MNYQPLWEYFYQHHEIDLLIPEMEEVVKIVTKMQDEEINEEFDKLIKQEDE